ncbi:hypothetical protein [Glutamicibacter soli]|uniref:hypothetical protein n=1 Tax=Glutamicibacter soli TaxID=453836 RepID=UPI003FD18975
MTAFVKIADTWIETESIESITATQKENYLAAKIQTVNIITRSGQKHTGEMVESEVIKLLENLTGTNR